MNDFVLDISAARPVNGKERIKVFFREKFIDSRLESGYGISILSLAAIFIAFVVTKAGLTAGIGLIALALALPMVLLCLYNIKATLVFTIVFSFFFSIIKRAVGNIQLGLVVDALIALMFFGLVLKQVQERNWKIRNNAVNKVILAWIVYNLLQLVNPTAESRLAWFYTVRTFAGIMIMYYLLMYAIDNRNYFFLLIKIWISLTILAMIYGYIQEYIGLMPFEERWATATKERYALLFQAGKFRKFSYFSDPLVYGFMMAVTSILCFILAQGPIKKGYKISLYTISVLMMYAMLFSGTRTAFVLPMAAFLFYAVISFKKNILIFGGVMGIVLLILLNIPANNANLYRFQSAFNPTEDASYRTRARNQAFIQPFIQKHPLGGGLGSVGEWGKKFSPWSPLANFPPDSGFVRTAVEQGWLGLLLYCTLLFLVFKQGIHDYFRIRDPLLKNISLGMLTVLFSLVVANFPQEAIGQYPINILFFVAIALITKAREFDLVKT
ncbi:MAG: O-antigen ligase family protein [Ignavibacteriaceae bacterium]|nr:O-antigen ligase family protein [Ignavibacteriaceae bacterium]